MRSGQTAREIDEEAARWAMRLDRSDLDPSPDADLQAWLSGDERRNGALLRAQAALSFVDRARALATPEAAQPTGQPPNRRALIAAGAVGFVTLAAGATLLTRRPGPARFSTVRGESRRVPLADGSVAEINTATAIEVTMAQNTRRVRLERGEAWFSVAKDSSRPFVVEASDLRIAAVGTAFSVNGATPRLEVLVTEGVVEAWRSNDAGPRLRIEAGSRMTVGEEGRFVVAEAADDIARDLAWRSGQIDLAGRTLAQAAAEFNRYNRRPIVIDDPALASETLVGLFATNEAGSFARAVGNAFGVGVVDTPADIRIGGAPPGK